LAQQDEKSLQAWILVEFRKVELPWQVCGYWQNKKTAESKIDSALQMVVRHRTMRIFKEGFNRNNVFSLANRSIWEKICPKKMLFSHCHLG
jgi:hypothetical protein